MSWATARAYLRSGVVKRRRWLLRRNSPHGEERDTTMNSRRVLSLIDATFLAVETTATPMHVASLQIFQIPNGAPDSFVRDVVTAFRSPGPLTPPFGLKLAGGPLARITPALVPADDVDLEYHIRHTALPAPGGERELGELISHLHSVKLDRSRPLWTCHVVDGLERNRFAVYCKIHHALTDGVGGMQKVVQALAKDPAGTSCAPWHYQTPQRDKRTASSRQFRLQSILRTGVSLLRGIAGLSRLKGSEPVRLPFEGSAAPALNGRVTAARRVATQQLDLKRIQEVCERTGTSVNDVFLAICASALRRHLVDSGLLPRKPLFAGVPMNLREPGETGANAFGFVWASLATDVTEPAARLEAIHESMQAAKNHLRAMKPAARKVFTLSMMAPAVAVIATGVADRVRPPMNVTISNVPGPDEAMYLNGARLEAFYPVSATFQGLALNITCVTYDGQFNIGFTGSRDSLPHLQRLAVYASDALDELEATTVNPTRSGSRAPAGTR
ncbi:MAG TPA: wax ester/triacylglycerol synthase family O-acyltransferase [Nakamurella sp.]|nr:wax ester/triacylglycerol synthase family O-acyltransferase [Nakamurella sp.]